jgi:hypothetical protein
MTPVQTSCFSKNLISSLLQFSRKLNFSRLVPRVNLEDDLAVFRPIMLMVNVVAPFPPAVTNHIGAHPCRWGSSTL